MNIMKNIKEKWEPIFWAVFLIVGVISGFFSGWKSTKEVYDRMYPEFGIVVDTSPGTDLVIVRAGNGNLFAFSGVEDWECGDGVVFMLDSMGTEEVDDDEMTGVMRYSSFGVIDNES